MRRTLLLLIALLATAGFVAGCGTSGGNDAADPTTTTAPAGDDTSDDGTDTTEPADEETTTTEASDDEGPSGDVSELEALLPTAEDLGDGWTLDDSDSGEDDGSADPMDEQFKEACPGLEELDFLDIGTEEGGETASVGFRDADDRELSVELNPSSDEFTEDNIDALVAAFDDCGEISLTDEDGIAYQVNISAERDGSRGDFGMRLDMKVSIDFLGTAIELDLVGQAFSVDSVSAFISSTSGISETATDFEMVPYDEELLGDISDLMENRLNDR